MDTWVKRLGVRILILGIGLAFLVPNSAWCASNCSVCGVDLGEFGKTKFTLISRGGEVIQTCSFYCTAVVLAKKGKRFKRITVTDYNTGEDIDARLAYYVIGSAVRGGVHQNSYLPFWNKSAAYTFISRNGGMIRDFKAALKAATNKINQKDKIPPLTKTSTNTKCFTCHTEGTPSLF